MLVVVDAVCHLFLSYYAREVLVLLLSHTGALLRCLPLLGAFFFGGGCGGLFPMRGTVLHLFPLWFRENRNQSFFFCSGYFQSYR